MQTLAREKVFELAANPAMSDEEVVRRVIDGEVALFEVLMRRHNQKVYRAVRALIRDEAEAEDAMQQAYLSAYTNLRQFAGAARFSTWLVRIAVNEALGRLRRRSRLVSIDEEVEAEVDEKGAVEQAFVQTDPEKRAISSQVAEVVQAAVDSLPEAYSVVFMLREVEGMDTATTAATLGVSEDVVKTRLSRARVMLRKRLDEKVGASFREAYQFLIPRCNAMVARVLAGTEAAGAVLRA